MSATDRKAKWLKKIEVTMKRQYVKFYVGDYAWFMKSGHIYREEIEEVRIRKDGMNNLFLINSTWYCESNVHQTKQALWKSLINDYIERENYKNENVSKK